MDHCWRGSAPASLTNKTNNKGYCSGVTWMYNSRVLSCSIIVVLVAKYIEHTCNLAGDSDNRYSFLGIMYIIISTVCTVASATLV